MSRAVSELCSQTELAADLYVDGELKPEQTAEIAKHLADCPQCAALIAGRTALRNRIRVAARSTAGPSGLDQKIRDRVFTNTGRSRSNKAWPLLAIAATALLAVGVQASRRLGGVNEAPSVMQIGLREHVNCAVLRKHASEAPTIESMAQGLGRDYAPLLPAMQRHLPGGYHIAEGHVCSYRGRLYTHLLAVNGNRMISLLVTNRTHGEAFEKDLHATATEAGDPLYTSSAQRFSLAGFETRDHLIYLISDRDPQRNLEELKSMTSDVDHAIRQTEI